MQSAKAQPLTRRRPSSIKPAAHASGIVASIDVLRAQVQLGTEQLRLTSANNEGGAHQAETGACDGSARRSGLHRWQRHSRSAVAGRRSSRHTNGHSPRGRTIWQHSERLKASESERQAAAAEYLPSVRVAADYGTIGNTVSSAKGTYSGVWRRERAHLQRWAHADVCCRRMPTCGCAAVKSKTSRRPSTTTRARASSNSRRPGAAPTVATRSR